jgi:hypothetical protein
MKAELLMATFMKKVSGEGALILEHQAAFFRVSRTSA